MSQTPDAFPANEAAPKPYTVTEDPQFVGFKSVEVTKVDDSKPWKPALEVTVTLADGSQQARITSIKP